MSQHKEHPHFAQDRASVVARAIICEIGTTPHIPTLTNKIARILRDEFTEVEHQTIVDLRPSEYSDID